MGSTHSNEDKRVKKAGFLSMELADIRNNKGQMTLQVRSVEHLQTWLRKNERVKSELLVQPMEIRVEQMDKAGDGGGKWWVDQAQEEKVETGERKEFKRDKDRNKEINEIAK